jgi:hypothetical protein
VTPTPMTREEVAVALERAAGALKANDPTTARRLLEPLAAVPRVEGVVRLIRGNRSRAARDAVLDLLADWSPPADAYEAALRQRDRQFEVAG